MKKGKTGTGTPRVLQEVLSSSRKQGKTVGRAMQKRRSWDPAPFSREHRSCKEIRDLIIMERTQSNSTALLVLQVHGSGS